MSSNTVHTKEELSDDSKALAEAIEQEKMHGWDFAFSLVVMVFSIGVVATSLTMPFSGTVGGITTEWYESPGLLPLVIGCSLFAAGLSVFVQSKHEQGREKFFKYFKEINPNSFLVSAGGIISYIYVLITWYDFFLASATFLLLYIGIYYLDDDSITRKLLKIYYSAIALSLAVFLSGIDATINAGYAFTTDMILVVTMAVLFLAMFSSAKKTSSELARKVRKLTIIAIVFPAALCPIFRYFLLVPLPKEGIVVEQVFNYTYYNYINTGTETEAMRSF
ncbi:tripartite tricarboxylate transporter TctB family protein [Vibrio hannami]|uniref:tripartite tricarboxylate transporter TctB family protein n=1 Tax=Vibrio hannami TaxID=2717094 RepID=UPI00240F19BC|nr:tripartite tricarboxylate transporter TctB family protein [Vibrio hannami]MDG3087872.1 tripartite tricarboxylate transporter TctB family protein [Vibrio hannami]